MEILNSLRNHGGSTDNAVQDLEQQLERKSPVCAPPVLVTWAESEHQELMNRTRDELVRMCRARGLRRGGNKTDLTNRLVAWHLDQHRVGRAEPPGASGSSSSSPPVAGGANASHSQAPAAPPSAPPGGAVSERRAAGTMPGSSVFLSGNCWMCKTSHLNLRSHWLSPKVPCHAPPGLSPMEHWHAPPPAPPRGAGPAQSPPFHAPRRHA